MFQTDSLYNYKKHYQQQHGTVQLFLSKQQFEPSDTATNVQPLSFLVPITNHALHVTDRQLAQLRGTLPAATDGTA